MYHNIAILKENLSGIADVRENEPLSKHSTFRVGGNADLFVEARDSARLEQILRIATCSGIPYKVIGGGSNILVGDRGFRGLVIKNKSSRRIYGDESTVVVDSGYSLSKLAVETASKGLAGLEWAAGIPGTIGGAIIGNAGAHGMSIEDVLIEVSVLNDNGEKGTLRSSEMGFAYRESKFRGNSSIVVLDAKFSLKTEAPETILERVSANDSRRKISQPKGPSAGSVFKNPESAPAGLLIEKAGLKGKTIGGARVSEKHANFIVNSGGATAQDIKELIDFTAITVEEQFGIKLQLEIELLGEWGR